jgi:hypothetical protein
LVATFGLVLMVSACDGAADPVVPMVSANVMETSPASEVDYDAVEPRGSEPRELVLHDAFLPDPTTLTGFGGGSTLATELNPACLGWVRRAPNHRLVTEGGYERLRVFVNGGDRDTTLIVKKPDGTFLCSDDVDGRHPLVEFPTTAGVHEIWVGTYERRSAPPYVLGVSRRKDASPRDIPSPVGAMPRVAEDASARIPDEPLEGNFAPLRLRPDFAPSPKILHGTSGTSASESIDASTLSQGCAGHITAQPDHLLFVERSIPSLVVAVDSQAGDTTLVIRRPDGRFYCDDDGGPGKAGRVRARFEAGTYRIWVGSFGAIENHPYRVAFSEDEEFGKESF